MCIMVVPDTMSTQLHSANSCRAARLLYNCCFQRVCLSRIQQLPSMLAPFSDGVLLLLPIAHLSSCQATSQSYKAYAQRLSSWGFAVLQYDFMRLSPWIDQLCHSDAAEVSEKQEYEARTPCAPVVLLRNMHGAWSTAHMHTRTRQTCQACT